MRILQPEFAGFDVRVCMELRAMTVLLGEFGPISAVREPIH
jgi:hypothetical protein